jgi:hypothetical protein
MASSGMRSKYTIVEAGARDMAPAKPLEEPMVQYRSVVTLAAALGIALAIAGRPAMAADPRLDLAHETLVKAQALVGAAEDPGHKRPFGGHAAKAAFFIAKALAEVELAKAAADKPQ